MLIDKGQLNITLGARCSSGSDHASVVLLEPEAPSERAADADGLFTCKECPLVDVRLDRSSSAPEQLHSVFEVPLPLRFCLQSEQVALGHGLRRSHLLLLDP